MFLGTRRVLVFGEIKGFLVLEQRTGSSFWGRWRFLCLFDQFFHFYWGIDRLWFIWTNTREQIDVATVCSSHCRLFDFQASETIYTRDIINVIQVAKISRSKKIIHIYVYTWGEQFCTIYKYVKQINNFHHNMIIKIIYPRQFMNTQ